MADLLTQYLAEYGRKKFVRGEVDCGQFNADWVELISGKNPGASLPKYHDSKGAALIIRQHGGLRHLGQHLINDIPGIVEVEDNPRRGDFGVVRHGKQTLFGICIGNDRWAVKTRKGMLIAPMQVLRVWRYGGGSLSAEAIGMLVLTAIGAATVGSTVVIGSITVATIVGAVIITAASIGIQYALASMNRPKSADPQVQQQTVRQAIGFRVGHYGQVKVGGTLALMESKAGRFHRIIMTGSGEIDEVVEHWLNSQRVTINEGVLIPGTSGGGFINEQPLARAVLLNYRLGLDDSPVYEELIAWYGTSIWTTAHKLNGISTALVTLGDPGPEQFGEVFQSGIPNYRQVIRARKCFDPRVPSHDPNVKSTWTYSDNAAICILDYLKHPDGYNLNIDDIDLDSFSDFADLCDELVPLKAGGFERRYRMAGTYSFGEFRKEPLKRMLQICDGQILQLANGKVGIAGGKYEPPEVTIDNSIMVSQNWDFDPDAAERVNELKPTFMSSQHDYQEVEAAAWIDQEAIDRDGLISQTFSVVMCPSHAQAQRLAKIAGRRLNSPIRGELQCNVGGFRCFQQRFIRIIDETMEIDGVFLIERFDFVIASDNLGVNLQVVQVDGSDWDWDPATEEGDPPPPPDNVDELGLVPIPENVVAFVEPVIVSGGVVGGQLRVTWDLPERQNMASEVRYRNLLGSTYGPYVLNSVSQGLNEFLSPTIQNDGSLYEVEVRFIVGQSTRGDWSPIFLVTATADPIPTDPVGSVIVEGNPDGNPGEIYGSWITPGSPNFSATRVYTNTAPSLTGATLQTTQFSAPSVFQEHIVDGLAAGTYYLILVALNGSGIPSTPTISGSVTIT